MTPDVLWQPPIDVRETSRIGRWMSWLEDERGLAFADYSSKSFDYAPPAEFLDEPGGGDRQSL